MTGKPPDDSARCKGESHMKKQIRLLLLLLAALGILSGCGCKHTWTDATCTAPRTCTLCGKTEGEPLSHTWSDADCTTPKTCTLCGKTKGEPLPHAWVEANYQDPKTCSVCGETEGSPLTASFEEHGLVINLAENCRTLEDGSCIMAEPYDYVTCCSKDRSLATVGRLYICDYRIFQSDDTHAAVEGYEWRAFDVKVEYSDENASLYGYSGNVCQENYYAVEDWDDSMAEVSGTQWAYLSEFAYHCFVTTVNYHGTDYPCAFSWENDVAGPWEYIARTDRNGNPMWEECSVWSASIYVCVPIGYDGVVVGFRDGRTPWEDGMYVYDAADSNTLFFRMGSIE